MGVVLAAALIGWLGFQWFSPTDTSDPSIAPRFVEEATAAGIDHEYDGEFTHFVGGGVAVLDCDLDGRPDLFFAGGANPAALYRNASMVGGRLQFEQSASSVIDLTGVVGAYPLDVDSDRHMDLAVLRLGENVMLRGRGDCRFERANEAWSVDGGAAWTTGFTARWEGSSARPTMAFGNYLGLTDSGERTGTCQPNVLIRPDSTGTYQEPILLEPGWCSLSILFSDWDRSGGGDLRVSNDRQYYRDGQEQLWRIEEGVDPVLYTDNEGWRPLQIWGMGIASQDLTGDNRPEVFLTSMGDNKLQILDETATGPEYVDIALELGATAHRPYTGDEVLPSTAWHPEFQDVNNDGLMDLYISKGNVEAMVEAATDDPNNLLLGQADGSFIEGAMEAGLANYRRTRGAALADFNLDGLLDLVEVNRRENITLWRNAGTGTGYQPGAMGHWIAIRLSQTPPNIDAVGAWIEVDAGGGTVERELTIGGGHGGDQQGWVHFGLGAADAARIRVRWPDGELGPWQMLEANRFAVIERNAAEPAIWTPGTDLPMGAKAR